MAAEVGADGERELVAVVGAGLVGAMTTITLAKRGYRVKLYELREDWRIDESAALKKGEEQSKSATKRSINLALSYRGQCALRNVGVLDELMEDAIPMRCRAIHSINKTKTARESDPDSFQPYDEVDSTNFINSISRQRINNVLLDRAEAMPNVEIYFGHRLKKITDDGSATFDVSDGRTVVVAPRLIVGADGAYSGTRDAMLRLTKTENRFERSYISHGYKELCIPPDPKTGDFALSCPEALHIWPRKQFMLIGLPNKDKSFTCTLFAPFYSERDEETGALIPGMEDVKSDEEITQYFAEHFPDVVSVIPDYIGEFRRNPASKLVQIKVQPWNYSDKVVLLGDAAHAMVPFYGQGMNSGFEDVLCFNETLDEVRDNIAEAVPLFASTRRVDGDSIAKLSMHNYVEMRHHSGDPMFRLRKQFEGLLNWMLPNSWIPLYKMVAFTRIPYHQAIERSQFQDRALQSGQAALGALAGGFLSYEVLSRTSLGHNIAKCASNLIADVNVTAMMISAGVGLWFLRS